MERHRPRELELAKEELLILLNCLDRENAQIDFLELHARALLTHIQNARPTVPIHPESELYIREVEDRAYGC